MTLTDEKALDELRLLNKQFRAGLVQPSGLLEALKDLGIEPSQAILLSIYPDSGNTWCGQLDDVNLGLIEFDIDLADCRYSSYRKLGIGDFRKRQGQVLLSALEALRAEVKNDR